jgi:hypothetical protein
VDEARLEEMVRELKKIPGWQNLSVKQIAKKLDVNEVEAEEIKRGAHRPPS